jgi:hypothetical protein
MSGTASMARERQRPVAMTEAPFTIDTPTGPIAGFTSTETGSELLLFGLAPSTANGPFTVAQHVADAIAVLHSLGRRRTTLPDWRRRESEDSLDDTENPVHDAVVAQPYSGVRRDEHGVELESREVRAAAHGAGVRQIALAWQLQGSPQACRYRVPPRWHTRGRTWRRGPLCSVSGRCEPSTRSPLRETCPGTVPCQ